MTKLAFRRMLGASLVATGLFPLICLLALAACAEKPVKPPAPQVVVTGCTAFPRLTASRQDTAQTREAILAYVTTWDALCAPATGAKP